MNRIPFLIALLCVLFGCGGDEDKTINLSGREVNLSCQEAKEQLLGEKCTNAMLGVADSFKKNFNACPDGYCYLTWLSIWVFAIDGPCNPGYDLLASANKSRCGDCAEKCGTVFNLGCLSDRVSPNKTGSQCVRELHECIEQCDL